jgi:hypothetical protein
MRGSTAGSAGALLLSTCVLTLGCGATRPPADGVLERAPSFPNVLEAGMAFAPVGHIDPVEDAAEVAAFLSNELYVAVLVSLPGTPLVAPEHVLEQLELHGDLAFDRFRAFRRDLVQGELPSKERCTQLSQLILHRYVLLSWVDEERSMGVEEISQDYVEADFANDVRRATFERIEGRIEGVILDLWEGELLWRGVATYETERLFGESGAIREEIKRARVDGATRFSLMLARR